MAAINISRSTSCLARLSLASCLRVTSPKGSRFVSNVVGILDPSENARRENWRRRVDLATAYRAFEKLSLNEGVCNHLSMIAPAANGSDENVMLIVPYGLHWSEVLPSTLVGLNDKQETVEGEGDCEISAATIHSGVHQARPDAVCVFHLHPPYATAISLLKDPRLRMYHQNSCLFYNSIAYDQQYSGLSQDDDEGTRTASQLGDKNVLFMCNHGVLMVGPTAARTFNDAYYLERSSLFQVLAQSTNQELQELDEDVCKLAKEQWDGVGVRDKYCNAFFESMKRILAKEDPIFNAEIQLCAF